VVCVRCKKWLIDYSGWGHPEWNEIVNEEKLKELMEEIEKHNWVRPDIECAEWEEEE